ncbi:MAG: hypothetical protein CYPHOPRED_004447 [Cyphobasidiales sp. Tagirdzhanova-0007]|nr:MAG: hypothetical protein CYPHOPRED_004447 [Cyphobasidiales sp. Tagirdzhanova-0007]
MSGKLAVTLTLLSSPLVLAYRTIEECGAALTAFNQAFISPNNQLQVQAINSTLFTENAIGKFVWALPHILPQFAKESNITLTPTTNVTNVLAQHATTQICTQHQQYCLGTDQQYAK